jgi:hypothetical protein
MALGAAVRRTLAYADVFEYPLTAAELHRYLHGQRATIAEIRALVEDGLAGVSTHDGYYALTGCLAYVAERRRRLVVSAPLLRRASLYGQLIKHLPFVRMVGLTGSLVMRNVCDGEARDIDVMVVTRRGRVWLGRAAVIAMVYLARLAGDRLCPNYVVSEEALALDDHSIYSAHELAQMVPLYGAAVYQRLWDSNPEMVTHLPNAGPLPSPSDRLLPGGAWLKRAAERLLGGVLGDVLEGWERARKMRRLRRMQRDGAAEIVFSSEQCKGHFGRHRARVLGAYHDRLAALEPRAENHREEAP